MRRIAVVVSLIASALFGIGAVASPADAYYCGTMRCTSVTNVGDWGNVYAVNEVDGSYVNGRYDITLSPGETTRGQIANADGVYVGYGQRVHRGIRINGWWVSLSDLYGPVLWNTNNVQSRDVYVWRF